MNTKQEALDLVLTGLWHAFIVGLAVVVISLLSGCASRVPAPDTRTDNEKRLDQLEYQQRIQQMNNLLLTHSGGTDQNGCHYNHKTGDYHCHR